jgi:HD-like signal output (HDOD) protein
VAGLLHDIGRLAFVKLPAELRIREQEWLAAGFPVVYAETPAYGLDHAALGAKCLRAWALPESLVNAVGLHHRPGPDASPLGGVLTLAEDLGARAGNTDSEDLWPEMRRAAACLATGITLDRLDEFYLGHSLLRHARA